MLWVVIDVCNVYVFVVRLIQPNYVNYINIFVIN